MKDAQEEAKRIIAMYVDVVPISASFEDTAQEAGEKISKHGKSVRRCALIHVDGILNEVETISQSMAIENVVEFWQKVKSILLIF